MTSAPVPYTPAVKAGDLLFISGQIGQVGGELVDGGFEAQVKQALANVSALLAQHQVDTSAIIKSVIFLTDMAAYGVMNDLYGEWLGGHLPARSCVAVSALPKGALFEIEAIAHVG